MTSPGTCDVPYQNYLHLYIGSHQRRFIWLAFKENPMILMDLKVHLLIHLFDEVELVGVLSCNWISSSRGM
jgi:hypothetical protein